MPAKKFQSSPQRFKFPWKISASPVQYQNKSITLILKYVIYFSVPKPFFNPVVNISFVEIKYLSNALDACTCIICVFIARCLISSEYSRVQYFFQCVPERFFPCVYSVFRFTTERTLVSCYFFRFSHTLLYYIMRYLSTLFAKK